MWWVPWFLLKYPQMCGALRIPKAVLTMGFTRTTPTHWSMATVLFRKKKEGQGMRSWCLGDYGDTQSTEEQLNCSVLWELKSYLWNLKIHASTGGLPHWIPGLLLALPAGTKTRERPGNACAFCALHLMGEKRHQIFPKVGFEWAKNNKS